MCAATRRSETPSPTTRPRRRFDWLREKKHRRSALAEVHRAVRNGWDIDAEDRSALIQELGALLESGELTPREGVRVCRIFLAMDEADTAVRATVYYQAACAAGQRPPGRPRGGSITP